MGRYFWYRQHFSLSLHQDFLHFVDNYTVKILLNGYDISIVYFEL